MRLPLRSLSKAEPVVAFAVLLGLVVALQVAGAAYASGFGGYPDEPAHVVTSLMVRDFIAGLDFRHPWQFAQQYYYHYPQVAIGHWPPVFYGALGIWFLVFDASRGTALMFIAVVAATTASIIYLTGRRLIGRWAGVMAAALFVASPLVQESSARVMTEHLSTLGMLVSTLSFARFARTGRIGDGLAFGPGFWYGCGRGHLDPCQCLGTCLSARDNGCSEMRCFRCWRSSRPAIGTSSTRQGIDSL